MNDPYAFAEQEEIASPQLVYYPAIIRNNIRRMKKIAQGTDRLWPHIKTHKCAQVVRMLIEEGITKVKCATIAEAEMAAQAGCEKLILAYPLVGPNIGRFIALAKAYPQVEMFAIADDAHQVQLLGEKADSRGMTVNLLLDVDMGQHRTGVSPEKILECYRSWDRIAGIRMRGMHCYDGHRHESDPAVRMREVERIDLVVEGLRERLMAEGADCSVIVMGGTPSFPCHKKITEAYLSPGTCIIQDAGYRDAYPDLPFVPGAALLCRVISRPSKDTFTLDLGTKAVASDPPVPRAQIVGFEYAQTVIHNEEHLVVRVPEKHIRDIPSVGTVLYALPLHVCPTSALYPSVPAVEDGHLKDWWEITARNRKITY